MWSRACIYCAGSYLAEQGAPKHDHDLHLALRRPITPAAWRSRTMDHVMLQGTQIPNVEGPGPLIEADAACLVLQLHVQLAAPKNRQAGMKQRGTTIRVPAILSFSHFADLHRRVGEGIVRQFLVHEGRGIGKDVHGQSDSSNLRSHSFLQLMQPPTSAFSQCPSEECSTHGPDGLQIGIAVETLALGGLVLRGYIPHKFALHTTPAFVLADTAARLEVVGQTFISELRPARTVLLFEIGNAVPNRHYPHLPPRPMDLGIFATAPIKITFTITLTVADDSLELEGLKIVTGGIGGGKVCLDGDRRWRFASAL